MAEKLGADFIINSAEQDLHGRLTEITSREGPGIVIEAAGNPDTYRTAVEEVAFCGRIVCIGYAKDDVALATNLFIQKEMDIRGSRNAITSDFENVIWFLEKTFFPVDEVISRIVKPEETVEALREWSANPGKYLKILVEF